MDFQQDIEIIQLKNPSLFYAKEIGSSLSSERADCEHLLEKINHYFNNENLMLCHFMPKEGEVCIGRRACNRKWCRVKVEAVFNRSKGTEGSCFLLDEGTTESIPLQWLRQAHQEHLKIPFQVKKYCLYGVKPLNLRISTKDLTVNARPSDDWDVSAVTFMRKHIEKSIRVQAVSRFVDQDDFHHVDLYLTSAKREKICLNNEFVRQEYAVNYDPDQETTVDDIDQEKLKRLLAKNITLRSYTSDSEEGRSRSYTSIHPSQDHLGVAWRDDQQNLAVDVNSLNNLRSPERLRGMSNNRLSEKSQSDNEHPRKPVTMAQLRQKYEKSAACSDTETFKKVSKLPALFPVSSSPSSPVLTDHAKPVNRIDKSSSPKTDTSPLQNIISQLRFPVPQQYPVQSSPLHTPPHTGTASPTGIVKSSSSTSPTSSSILLNPSSPRRLLENLLTIVRSPPVSSSDSESRKSDSAVSLRKPHLSPSTVRPVSEGELKLSRFNASPFECEVSSNESLVENDIIDTLTVKDTSQRASGCVTFEGLMSGDQSVPLTRARLPKAASVRKKISPPVTESDHDNSSAMIELLTPTFNRHSSSGTSSDEKSRIDGTKSILKKSPSSNSPPERSMVRFKNSEAQEDAIAKKCKMMGQITGKRLLNTLAGGQDSSSKKMNIPSEGKLNIDGVLVHSKYPIKPVCTLKDAPLHPIIKKAFEIMDFPTPTVVQSYAWPCILRGGPVVGLSPKFSGKTLAYLAPIISALLNTTAYADIPPGNGPLAIILVPFWGKAQSVYDSILSLLQRNQRPRVLVCYGGGEEDSQVIPLMNGCEILVTTPRSLTRMMQKRATSLNRLCHIIIDDADVLLEVFMPEMQNLMTEYSNVLQENPHRSTPQQVLLFGRQWCHIIDSFMEAFMANPILLITSGFEASVYGKVQQIPYLWKADQKVGNFMDLMSTVATGKTKVIVFCVEVNATLEVMQLLYSRSLYAIHAHHQMDLLGIEQVASEWNMPSDSFKILVCTDECIAEMKISDAMCVVHFELPSSKTRFGNRLTCMSQYYWNSTDRDKENSVQPVSHIIVTEQIWMLVPSVVQLLKRSKTKVPRDLRDMEQGMMQTKESNVNREYCLYMKAYGMCKYKNKCEMRHIIIPEVDNLTSNLHLVSGEVKVFVTHIVDATHFFVRLLEHRPPEGTVRDLSETKIKMQFEMLEWFSDLANRKKYRTLSPGDLCAVSEDEETFQRVKICDIADNSPGSGIKVSVLFVDEGRKESIQADKLYALPSHLKEIPYQATEVFICRVKPVDEDEDWTVRASYFVYDMLYHRELDGRIVLSIGNTLWLDPLVERLYLKDTKTYSNHLFARSELLKNGFAVDNPSHIQNLYEACKDKIEIPDLNRQTYSSEKKMDMELLPESKKFHDVFLSAVELPNLLFLQRNESIERLERLNDDINERMKNVENVSDKKVSYKAGDVCLAKFPENDCWYRAMIMEELEDGGFKVLYADFGDLKTTTKDGLACLPEEFMDLPFQAVECELAHISPRGEDWDFESGDLIWDLTHFVTGDKKMLVAEVVSKSAPTFIGSHKYCVELYETSTADDVNIATELIWSGFASPVENSSLRHLFLPPPPSQFYRVPVMKIQDLCCLIYWERDGDKAQAASKEILRLVMYTTKGAPLNLLAHNALAAIIKLIGRSGSEVIHKQLVESLLVSAEASDRLCEEILDQDGFVGIIKCLEQNSRSWIQEQAISAISRFLSVSTRFLQPLENDHVIQVLCELLQSAEDLKVLTATCRALTDMCQASVRIGEVTHEFGVCTGIIQCLEENTDPKLRETAIMLLDQLLDIDNSQTALTKEKLARAVVGVMDKEQTDTCINCGVKFCMNFAEMSRKHKTILLHLNVVKVINSILQSSNISVVTKELCTKLNDCLVVKVPSTQSLSNQPISTEPVMQQKSFLPPVSWSQDSFTATLAIKVKGVAAGSKPLSFKENSVTFSIIVENQMYRFDWELYSNIFPGKCRVAIKASEVLVSLRKNEKGRWPRLLKSKHKPANLSIDFERFMDSSDDDGQLNEEAPFRLKKKKVKSLTGEGPRVRAADFQSYEDRLSSSSNSDSLSDIDDIEHDPYNILSVRNT